MERPNSNRVMIDWLSLTFPDTYTEEQIQMEFVWSDPWPERGFGTRGYRRSAVWGGITMSWEGSRGVHVELPAQALRELELVEGWDWRERLRKWGRMGANVTRLDVAFDDVECHTTMQEIRGALAAGQVTTRAQGWGEQASHKLATGAAVPVQTLYVGAPSSDSRLRMYDKACEQMVEGPWIRFEMQWRRNRADDVAAQFVLDGEEVFARLLMAFIQFREDEGHEWMKDNPIASWWSKFLRGAAALKLTKEGVERGLQDVAAWFVGSMSASLALVAHWFGDDMRTVSALIEAGRGRWNAKQKAMVQAFDMLRANRVEGWQEIRQAASKGALVPGRLVPVQT